MKDKLCARDKCDDVLLTAHCWFNTYQPGHRSCSFNASIHRMSDGKIERERERKLIDQDWNKMPKIFLHSYSRAFCFRFYKSVHIPCEMNAYDPVLFILGFVSHKLQIRYLLIVNHSNQRESGYEENEHERESSRKPDPMSKGACTMHWYRKPYPTRLSTLEKSSKVQNNNKSISVCEGLLFYPPRKYINPIECMCLSFSFSLCLCFWMCICFFKSMHWNLHIQSCCVCGKRRLVLLNWCSIFHCGKILQTLSASALISYSMKNKLFNCIIHIQ